MIARLVECSDYDELYGILTVENKSAEEVQETIYKIKNYLHSIGVDDWCVEDILNEFPEEWEWSYEKDIDIIEI